MALTAAQLVACRRYMGYSVSGDGTSLPFRELVYSNVAHMGLSLDYRLAHLSAEEEAVVVNTYLTPLAAREQEIQGAADNLDTDAAAVWKRNPRELQDRIGLYNWLRRDLCTFLGFPPGPQLGGGGRVVRS
ncbi:hypothetical protein R5W24_000486 [Gemmata sp. JC717]|uniref:hypothetical protein n=1 Tax=Gemmata algarum TaxID=2975278 RepID=UPI0021BB020A|nr:hypothetical protein [Gemmata algarum]MDY3551410.1 hypothetical protein [Gemmata algarum]